MEESTIVIHFDQIKRSEYENYVLHNIQDIWKHEWMKSDFARYCVEKLDKCEYAGPSLVISPLFGPIDPLRMSGTTITLITAYNHKENAYPFGNLGENAGEALYLSGIGSPTQWTWVGYAPKFLPNQKIQIASTGEIVLGKDWIEWSTWNAPDFTELFPGIKYACDLLNEEDEEDD